MQVVSAQLIEGKKVLLRMDLDVPLRGGVVAEDIRLKAALPTLELCLSHAKSTVVMGHIGRPKGEVAQFSVAPIVAWLESWFCDLNLPLGKLNVLENLRFEAGEDECSMDFAKQLASFGDFYVNEAFAAHHKAASTTILPTLLPHAAGLHFTAEVSTLTRVRENPKRPLIAIIGGAKVEDKYPAVQKLSQVCDAVLVGGLLAKRIREQNLSVDPNVVLGRTNTEGIDISEETIQAFSDVIRHGKEIIWIGPLGKYEEGANFGNQKIVQAVIDSGAESIIGGGDTLTALDKYLDKFSFVSVGGGATLDYLVDGTLPTIDALNL